MFRNKILSCVIYFLILKLVLAEEILNNIETNEFNDTETIENTDNAYSEDTSASIFSNLQDRLVNSVSEYANYFTRSLAEFTDKQIGSSHLGKLLNYKDIKPRRRGGHGGNGGNNHNNNDNDDGGGVIHARRRTMKIHTALLPLVFQIGATSTWLILTGLLTAKSVLIGLLLLVFKIAVSSAKVSSFFTALKLKHKDSWHGHSHNDWGHEHGRKRSLTDLETPHFEPQWQGKEDKSATYSTIPRDTLFSDSYDPSKSYSYSGGEPYRAYDYADDELGRNIKKN